MKITTLIENTALSPRLTAEHGLSLFVEAAGHTFLFDAGQSVAFADNARKLHIDLRRAEFAVLSHGHYDHGGGMLRFLECNHTAKIHVNQNAFGGHYNAAGRYIGLSDELRRSSRLILTGDEHTIAPGLTLHTCNDRPRAVPIESSGLTEQVGDFLLPEEFRHEQSLLIEENGRRILLSGCAHKGVLNLLHWFRPDVFVGGFHFKQLSPDDPRLRIWGEAMAKYDTVFYTGHCTGAAQYAVLKELLGDRLNAISTGAVFEV
ncbi:MAG: MBL fold metallo-hydrolase [Oscillospiraceae bacterium]|nr:MBL fold metallo-hydrolase [Oscillospiraceae bacterium]